MTKADSPTERSGAHIFRGAGYAARVRPWPGEALVAHLVTVDQGSDLPAALLRTWLNELRHMGYTSVRTGALAPSARRTYDAIGFSEVQTLALLRATLTTRRADKGHHIRLRKGTNGDLEALSALDTRAFPAGWGLDVDAIGDAMSATPSHRLRVAVTPATGEIVGYAVTGRAGRASFLQRLAVSPSSQRGGVGSRLVLDAQTWARRWRSTTMTVNTQAGNEPALLLYQRSGFVLLADQLTVLQRLLDQDV